MTAPSDGDGLLDDATAITCYQEHLDVSSRLVHQGETLRFCDHIVLPYIFHTNASEEIVETVEDLAADIQKITDWLRANNATDYHRIARQARFLHPDLIEGYHATYALRGALPIVKPYANRMLLRRIDGHWRACFSEHELSAPLFAERPVKPAPGRFARNWASDSGAATRDQMQALPIYQGLIDVMSDAVNGRDFDAWAACFRIPHHIHYDAVDHVARAPSDVRAFHDTLCGHLDALGAVKLVRRARFAAFVSDDRLLGYHETTMADGDTVRFGPVKSRMIFVLTDDDWKCASVTNSLSNTGFLGGAFQPSGLLPTMREIQERMRK